MTFVKAVKWDAKLRLAIAGPSGSGKTYTALKMATIMAQGQPIAVVDTEHGSAKKYADLFAFDTMEPTEFSPDTFVSAIEEAEAAGYAVIILDSLSHAWAGKGGLLEIVDEITRRSKSANSYLAWKDATPKQNKMIDTIIGCGIHVIATLREKQGYVLEKDAGGKQVPRKVGLEPIQRDGVEYEFDVFCEMDIENTLTITKTRCPALTGKVYAKPDTEPAATLLEWLKGEKPPVAAPITATDKPPAQPPVAAASNGKRPASVEAMRKRIWDLIEKAQLLSGGKRYNAFHLTGHLKKWYDGAMTIDGLSPENLIRFGKELRQEVAELEAKGAAEAGASSEEQLAAEPSPPEELSGEDGQDL